ncbi:MAG: lysophospholipid acyltransferase family protein [Verrucomicrobia bacterium]|nr:lysophospholipid acyltransferase family protein [Verrucomicrobiota bacterium]
MAEPVTQPTVRAPRSSGIVVPHRAKWYQRLAARLIHGAIVIVARTLRYKWTDTSGMFAADQPATPLVFVTWHNRLVLSMMAYHWHIRKFQKQRRLAALVSASKDGGMLAHVLELFDVEPVRGSSSRRGGQALLEMAGCAGRGFDLAVTPDGPRGPCYVMQPGVIGLAQVCGRPVVPVSYRVGWKIQMNSWDRFQIPLPFSRCEMFFGEPLPVPREADDAERERLRAELEARLRAITHD